MIYFLSPRSRAVVTSRSSYLSYSFKNSNNRMYYKIIDIQNEKYKYILVRINLFY